MFKAIKEFFTGKPAEVVAEVPYKVEATPAPVVDTADIAIAQLPDTVVVVPAAIVPAAVVEQAPAKKVPAVKKPRAPKAVPAVKAPKAPAVKKPRAPKAPK